jgi:hypothetical protein
MDAVGEADKVENLQTRNDTFMVRVCGVQASEVFPIVRHHRPAISTGVSQHGFVRTFFLAFPASWTVCTSCPYARSLTTAGCGKFSSAYSRAMF